MHIMVSTHCIGEGMDFVHEITKEQLDKIQEIIGADIVDDLTLEHPIEIKLYTPEQARQALIDGTAWGDGCSQEQARRIVDGEELLSDEEEEAQQDKEFAEMEAELKKL